MKSIKLKTLLAGLSFFAVSAIFAQDTPRTPKPDTTNPPKPDTSGMVKMQRSNSLVNTNIYVMTSFVAKSDQTIVAKKEAENEVLSQKSFAKISA